MGIIWICTRYLWRVRTLQCWLLRWLFFSIKNIKKRRFSMAAFSFSASILYFIISWNASSDDWFTVANEIITSFVSYEVRHYFFCLNGRFGRNLVIDQCRRLIGDGAERVASNSNWARKRLGGWNQEVWRISDVLLVQYIVAFDGFLNIKSFLIFNI